MRHPLSADDGKGQRMKWSLPFLPHVRGVEPRRLTHAGQAGHDDPRPGQPSHRIGSGSKSRRNQRPATSPANSINQRTAQLAVPSGYGLGQQAQYDADRYRLKAEHEPEHAIVKPATSISGLPYASTQMPVLADSDGWLLGHNTRSGAISDGVRPAGSDSCSADPNRVASKQQPKTLGLKLRLQDDQRPVTSDAIRRTPVGPQEGPRPSTKSVKVPVEQRRLQRPWTSSSPGPSPLFIDPVRTDLSHLIVRAGAIPSARRTEQISSTIPSVPKRTSSFHSTKIRPSTAVASTSNPSAYVQLENNGARPSLDVRHGSSARKAPDETTQPLSALSAAVPCTLGAPRPDPAVQQTSHARPLPPPSEAPQNSSMKPEQASSPLSPSARVMAQIDNCILTLEQALKETSTTSPTAAISDSDEAQGQILGQTSSRSDEPGPIQSSTAPIKAPDHVVDVPRCVSSVLSFHMGEYGRGDDLGSDEPYPYRADSVGVDSSLEYEEDEWWGCASPRSSHRSIEGSSLGLYYSSSELSPELEFRTTHGIIRSARKEAVNRVTAKLIHVPASPRKMIMQVASPNSCWSDSSSSFASPTSQLATPSSFYAASQLSSKPTSIASPAPSSSPLSFISAGTSRSSDRCAVENGKEPSHQGLETRGEHPADQAQGYSGGADTDPEEFFHLPTHVERRNDVHEDLPSTIPTSSCATNGDDGPAQGHAVYTPAQASLRRSSILAEAHFELDQGPHTSAEHEGHTVRSETQDACVPLIAVQTPPAGLSTFARAMISSPEFDLESTLKAPKRTCVDLPEADDNDGDDIGPTLRRSTSWCSSASSFYSRSSFGSFENVAGCGVKRSKNKLNRFFGEDVPEEAFGTQRLVLAENQARNDESLAIAEPFLASERAKAAGERVARVLPRKLHINTQIISHKVSRWALFDSDAEASSSEDEDPCPWERAEIHRLDRVDIRTIRAHRGKGVAATVAPRQANKGSRTNDKSPPLDQPRQLSSTTSPLTLASPPTVSTAADETTKSPARSSSKPTPLLSKLSLARPLPSARDKDPPSVQEISWPFQTVRHELSLDGPRSAPIRNGPKSYDEGLERHKAPASSPCPHSLGRNREEPDTPPRPHLSTRLQRVNEPGTSQDEAHRSVRVRGTAKWWIKKGLPSGNKPIDARAFEK